MAWPVLEVELPGRGRALVAARDIAAGELVLSDSPLLLFVHPAFAGSTCAQCLRALDGASSAPCLCGSRVCSAACAEASQAPGCAHTPELCAALQRAATSEPEALHLLRFLLQLYSLKAASSPAAAERFAAFSQLASLPLPQDSAAARLADAALPALHAAFVAPGRLRAEDIQAAEVASLLAIEAANGFCIMGASDDDTRLVRGTGIYLNASRLNHACFPNVARFDYFDAPGSSNTLLHFKALDPIPQGTELLCSYFPITLPLRQRQQRLLLDYGFECSCPRCELESTVAAGKEPMEVAEDGAEAWEQGGEGYSVEYSLWMLKFLCPRPGCGGTLAPPNPTADVMECNYCGALRTDDAFYAMLGSPLDE